jgi:hypothetical protein
MQRNHCLAPIVVSMAALLAGCAGTANGRGGDGVDLARTADVFCGSSFNCSRPAVFDYDRVRESTPEWKTIMAAHVQPGSARYELLNRTMHERLRERIRKVAAARKCDLVVRAGDIKDARGLEVVDLTADLTAELVDG